MSDKRPRTVVVLVPGERNRCQFMYKCESISIPHSRSEGNLCTNVSTERRSVLPLDVRAAISILCLGTFSVLTILAWVGCSQAESQTSTSKENNHQNVAAPFTNAMGNFQKPSATDLKQKLTPMQFEVTQHAATEPAFRNAFWDNKKAGIYVDIVSGQPLFSSLDKFDSGCGWPSFSKPLSAEEIVQRDDHAFGMERTEVRSKTADSHLGHVFDDGPGP